MLNKDFLINVPRTEVQKNRPAIQNHLNGTDGSYYEQYLTGNPQITHFRSIYRRHTEFRHVTQRLTPLLGKGCQTFEISSEYMHMLNKIMIVIPVSDLNVGKEIDRIDFLIRDQVIDSVSGEEIEFENELPQFGMKPLDDYKCRAGESYWYRNKIQRTVLGTIISVWFWFNDQILPLCLLSSVSVQLKIVWKQKMCLNVIIDLYGQDLEQHELTQFSTTTQEYLIQTRQPPIKANLFFNNTRYNELYWHPKKDVHILFGKQFNNAVVTLLCSLKKCFGPIDRNIRNRIVAEWANVEKAPINRFKISLQNWKGCLKLMYFVLYDEKHKIINGIGGSGIYSAQIYFTDLGNECEFTKKNCILQTQGHQLSCFGGIGESCPYPILSFSLTPTIHQPSGHLNLSGNELKHLIVNCDARVHSISIHGWKYDILRMQAAL
jgi:hypothetical protein